MTQLDVLRFLMAAETPRTVEGIEGLVRELAARRDLMVEGFEGRDAVIARIDSLLDERARIIRDTANGLAR